MSRSVSAICEGVAATRVLAPPIPVTGSRYVREQQTLDLMEALSKMTIRPARRLETFVPAMANKGRIRAGADADITIPDPETVIVNRM